MLRSKDVLFQRTGVSRLMTVLAAPGGVQLVAAAVENNGAADALVRIVSNASVPTGPKKGWWFTRRRVPTGAVTAGCRPGCRHSCGVEEGGAGGVRDDAANALRKMAAEPAIATAMRSRGSGLAASLLAASRDEGLDRNVRDTMGEAHALLVAGEGK
jgi:hypothetical protein